MPSGVSWAETPTQTYNAASNVTQTYGDEAPTQLYGTIVPTQPYGGVEDATQAYGLGPLSTRNGPDAAVDYGAPYGEPDATLPYGPDEVLNEAELRVEKPTKGHEDATQAYAIDADQIPLFQPEDDTRTLSPDVPVAFDDFSEVSLSPVPSSLPGAAVGVSRQTSLTSAATEATVSGRLPERIPTPHMSSQRGLVQYTCPHNVCSCVLGSSFATDK